MTTIVAIPFLSLKEYDGDIVWGRENIIRPSEESPITTAPKPIDVEKTAESPKTDLTTNQKIMYGVVIGLSIYGGLKMLKLI